jgi:asparagine synthase (glutamine-hydrolysing)
VCGIAGVFSQGKVDAASVQTMCASLAHRGPDDSGIVELADGRLILGHRRLSILDLSPLGHQPMSTPDRSLWTVFNGEIYNFREIRAELEQLGHRFRSDSDTEVLLAAYRAWGTDSVQRFRGMFAYALWDEARRELHLVRDRFGVKPLYYGVRGGTLAFASELRALNVAGFTARTLDAAAVTDFVQYGYVSAPRSIFADVRTVEPGTIVTFGANLELRVRRYWSLTELFDSPDQMALRQELESMPDEALIDRVEHELTEAFRYRMVADVPVGLFLSGGIDSSLVATLLARRAGVRLRTFTIGYGNSEFDETRYAREVAQRLGADHTEFIVSPNEALAINERLPEVADEPIGDSSLIPTLMVSQLARQHVTVALSADGADELFGGYARYQVCGAFAKRLSSATRWGYYLGASMLERLPPGTVGALYRMTRGGGPGFAAINDKLRKFMRMAKAGDAFEAYEGAVSEWSPADSRRLVMGAATPGEARETFLAPRTSGPHERFMHFDAARYLPGDLLNKIDRASMAVSLEAREPCLDHVMARLAVALPLRWKIRDGRNKYVLQKILARHHPPGFFERPKQGFSAPVAAWLRGPLREQLQDELAPARVRAVGILDPAAVSGAVDLFLRDERNVSAAGIWFLLQLQRWAGRWMQSNRVPEIQPRASAA